MTHHETPECSHGTCGAERECTGPCKLRMLSLPVIDPQYLDEQLGRDLPVMLPDDFLSGPRGWLWWVKWASVAIGCGLLLALIIYTTSK